MLAIKIIAIAVFIAVSSFFLIPAVSASSKRADEFQAQQNLYVAYKTARDAKKQNGGKFPNLLQLSRTIERQTPQFGPVETTATNVVDMKDKRLYLSNIDKDLVLRTRAKDKVCVLVAKQKGDSKLQSCSDNQSVFGQNKESKDRFSKVPDNYVSWQAKGFLIKSGLEAESNVVMLRTDLISRKRSMIKVVVPNSLDAPTMMGAVLGAKDHKALVGFYSTNHQLSIGVLNSLGQIEYVIASKKFTAKSGTYWLALDWTFEPRVELFDFDPQTTGISPITSLSAQTDLENDGLPGFFLSNGQGIPKVLEAVYR